MRRLSFVFGLIGGGALVLAACSGNSGGSGFGGDGQNGPGQDGSVGSSDDGSVNGDVPTIGTLGDGGHPNGDGGVACPSGLQCNVSCPGNATTTLSGKVYDPAMKNPLYNVAVYVPAVPLVPLPKGVPTGQDMCSCSALFQSGAVVSTTTAVDGTFKLTNVPVGNVPLVLQVGKWRKLVQVQTKSCQDNPQADKSLALPGTVASGDTNDNMPDLAVSTGGADTLECLMKRIGLPDSEYVAGAGGSGHVHVFSGGGAGGIGTGNPEKYVMPGAPASNTSLWSSQAQLMPFDIVLLSCEGGETSGANPPALESYLNAGGRAFASHFHYAWFSGSPIGINVNYPPPADWGTNLATWTADQGGGGNGPIGGTIDTTLNVGGGTFPKGVALQQWLTNLGALGQNTVGAGLLSIYQPRYNASVSSANLPSQPWITSGSNTMYFSFDTPVNAPKPSDGGSPNYCGRAVFSDLHVAGDPITNDTCNAKGAGGSPPPTGCGAGDLSPQEKALEFMLFDLSSCVIPDTVAPPDGGGVIIR